MYVGLINELHRLAAAVRLGLYDVPVVFVPAPEEPEEPQVLLDSAGPGPTGGFDIKFSAGNDPAREVFLAIANAMRTALDGMEAENYVEMQLIGDDDKPYIMTFRRGGHPTPHQLRERAEKAVRQVREVLTRDEHVVEVTTTRFSLLHGFPCRPNLLDCPMHLALEALDGLPAAPGRYRVTLDGGVPLIGEPVGADYDPLNVQALVEAMNEAVPQ